MSLYTSGPKVTNNDHITKCIADFGKLNFPKVVRFLAKAIFNTAPAASKNDAWFKRGQNRLKK